MLAITKRLGHTRIAYKCNIWLGILSPVKCVYVPPNLSFIWNVNSFKQFFLYRSHIRHKKVNTIYPKNECCQPIHLIFFGTLIDTGMTNSLWFLVKNVIKIYCFKQYNLRLIHPLTYRYSSYIENFHVKTSNIKILYLVYWAPTSR